MTILVEVASMSIKQTVVFWPYLWPEGSYLSPVNSWNSSTGILGLTEATDMTRVSLEAGAKIL